MTYSRLSLLVVCLMLTTACAKPRVAGGVSNRPMTSAIVVVRHAEKAPTPVDNPTLSAAGQARAIALDSALRAAPVTDVVVTDLQRTRLTAAVVIARSGARVHVVPIGTTGTPGHVAAVADTVRAIMQGGQARDVLVVGHSNTVTLIVRALGGPLETPLCDAQYSQFFRLRVESPERVALERTTYGARDSVNAQCVPMRP
jgi:broad specificity phosphatase PhoE